MYDIFEILSRAAGYGFMQKALICGIFTAISSSILGVFLVLRQLSMIGHGLSHVSFATIAFALVLGVNPLALSIPLVILASLVILYLSEKAYVYTDSAIGLIGSVSVAIGVIIVSTGNGLNVDIYSYLFGSILAISPFETGLSVSLSAAVVAAVLLLKNEWFAISFDREYAKSCGINIFFNDVVFFILQSVVIVTGVKIIGALLMSSLIVFPALASLQIAHRFRSMILFSALISVISVVSGIVLAFLINAPAGATIVCINAAFFLAAFLFNKVMRIK